MTTQNENPAVPDFIQQIRDQEIERDNAIQNGLPALRRLVTIAQGDTGQCEKVRNLLLGLYNGNAFPFDLTQFRGLDKDIFADCMAVVHMDARVTEKEVHEYIVRGGRLFESWAQGLNATKEQPFVDTWNEKATEVYETATAKGWWDTDRNDGEIIALMHSELSEALEAKRNGNPPDDHIPEFSGVEAEMADVVIRIMDYGKARGLSIAQAVEAKMAYNKHRPRKHGGKAF